MIETKRTSKKKCSICGKNIRIIVFNHTGHYDDGHYFGKIKPPIKKKGVYKQVGKSKLLGTEVNVVKWIGKEREFEYWECDKCFES